MLKNFVKFTLLATSLTTAGLLMTPMSMAADVPEGTKLAAKQTLNLQIGDNPKSLDPGLVSESIGSRIVNNLFETLTTYDAKGNIVPAAAVSWESSADNKVWTFKLRPDAVWSDGTPVTAKDFVTSWQRLVDPNTASEYSFYLSDLGVVNAELITEGKAPVDSLGVKALDDHTLQVTLDKPVPWFLEATPISNLAPVPSHLMKDWPNFSKLVSNGPYLLEYSMPNEKYVIVKNPKFHSADKTIITQVTFNVVRSANDAYKRFQAGDIDAFAVENAQLKSQLQKQTSDKFKVVAEPGSVLNFYEFNFREAPFNDVRARKALLLAVDNKEMAEKVFLNNVTPTSLWVASAIPGANQLTQAPYFNQPMPERIAEAKKLLEEAGYSASNPLKFSINYNTSDTNKLVAIMLQAQFKRAFGNLVDVSINNREWSTFLSESQSGVYPFFRMGWNADYFDPSTFYSIWTSNTPMNYAAYKSADYDKLFAALYNTSSAQERVALYQQMNDILNKDVVGIPLFSSLNVHLTVPNLEGYTTQDTTRRIYNMYLTEK
ncbi:hypothetical protein CKF54_07735 [Psittacicella hinzii]|uniref:Solute-binding protein family 5 domain-containing protein n=1 Tax=Psittacicella hinzii TaxID=2028575 RepID=A0A3A1XYJ0_9GAMM|nr:peptide ABC transporter substrate-binding protein [Psittacicella hinzii]RIY31092.1 hypothetical protein CKF54_07735 [Psittacicella hinzii]